LKVGLPLASAALFVAMAWWIGIHTNPRPSTVHSIGVVARYLKDDGTAGENRPVPPGCQPPKPTRKDCGPRTPLALMRYGPGSGLRVDMVVRVRPRLLSCGDAKVDLVVSGTPGFWREHNHLHPGITRVALGWDAATSPSPPAGVKAARSPALVALNSDPQAPLHPAFYLNTDSALAHRPYTRSYQIHSDGEHKPVGTVAYIHGWDTKGYQKPLHFRFTANWVTRRGFGSCYVNLPSLPANGAIAGQKHAVQTLDNLNDEKVYGVLPDAQPPTVGRVAVETDGKVALGDTTPAPGSFESIFVGTHGSPAERASQIVQGLSTRASPAWTCHPSQTLSYLRGVSTGAIPAAGSFSSNACGAVAVVNSPRADEIGGIATLLLGVLIGFSLTAVIRNSPKAWSTRPSPNPAESDSD
jgi:hypothetical protein